MCFHCNMLNHSLQRQKLTRYMRSTKWVFYAVSVITTYLLFWCIGIRINALLQRFIALTRQPEFLMIFCESFYILKVSLYTTFSTIKFEQATKNNVLPVGVVSTVYLLWTFLQLTLTEKSAVTHNLCWHISWNICVSQTDVFEALR
jgi:hypothetical protein